MPPPPPPPQKKPNQNQTNEKKNELKLNDDGCVFLQSKQYVIFSHIYI